MKRVIISFLLVTVSSSAWGLSCFDVFRNLRSPFPIRAVPLSPEEVNSGNFALELANKLQLGSELERVRILHSKGTIEKVIQSIDPLLWSRIEMRAPRNFYPQGTMPELMYQSLRLVDRVYQLEQNLRALTILYSHLKGNRDFNKQLDQLRNRIPFDLRARFDWDLRNGFNNHLSFRNRFWLRLLVESLALKDRLAMEPFWIPRTSDPRAKLLDSNTLDWLHLIERWSEKWRNEVDRLERDYEILVPRFMHEEEVWGLLVLFPTAIRALRKDFPDQIGVMWELTFGGFGMDPVEQLVSSKLISSIRNHNTESLRELVRDPYLDRTVIVEILRKEWPIPSDLRFGFPEAVRILEEWNYPLH